MAQVGTELDNLDKKPAEDVLNVKKKGKRSIIKRICDGITHLAKGVNTLWVLVPLVTLIEIAITLPLSTVHPDHPLHMAYYCTGCNTDVDTLVSALNDSEISCVSDAILLDIGESFQGFIQNYLATMLGHVLTVYALINTQDQSLSAKFGTKELLHILAYTLMLFDIIFEIAFLEEIELTDPSAMDISGYNSCDDTEVVEVTEHKEELVKFSYFVLSVRVLVAFFVVIIYVVKADVTHDDDDSDDEDDDKAAKITLISKEENA